MRKALISKLAALLTAGLAILQPAVACASSTGGLHLAGGFIQYQPSMMTLTAHPWDLELAAMQRARMNLVVLQFLQNNAQNFIPSAPGATDPTRCILSYASAHHMRVIIGLSTDDAWWMRWNDPTYLNDEAQKCNALAERVWARYGKYRAFAGWYIPQEMWDGKYTREQAQRLHTFLHTVSSRCHRLSGNKPVCIAPFFAHNATPSEITASYTTILGNSGVNVLMLQDGVGARNWHDDVAGNVVPDFQAFKRACLKTGVEMWSDLEAFQTTAKPSNGMVPASIQRIERQFTAEMPYVSQFVTFDFFHYFSPYRGALQAGLYKAYMSRFVKHPYFPMYGNMVEVDPGLSYYQSRTPRSIASEIRANGYTCVDYVVTTDAHINPALIAAFHAQHLGVWYGTFANGTYSTVGMPKGWEAWKSVTRADLLGHPLNDGFTRLCMNNSDYVHWKQHQITTVLHHYDFQGVMIMEPYWPGHGGIERLSYSCFCASCRRAFEKMFPTQHTLPDIIHPSSPNWPTHNTELWKDWLIFRQRTVTQFVNTLVNGSKGIRKSCANKKVCIWVLALKSAGGLQQVESENGVNPGAIAGEVRPDCICLEADWPDWMIPQLPPDYVQGYKPVVTAIRTAVPGLRIIIQADIGSSKQDRRGTEWLNSFRAACRNLGTPDTIYYEYSIGKYIYTDPPTITGAREAGGSIFLTFNRGLKPPDASFPAHYSLSRGKVSRVIVEGNLVTLVAVGLPPNGTIKVTALNLSDDPAVRLFHDMPPAISVKQSVVIQVH